MKTFCVKSMRVAAVAALFLANGCAMFRASTTVVDPNKATHFTQNYDYSDMKNITQEIVNQVLSNSFITKQQEPSVFMIAGIENRTSAYVDTKLITDSMRNLILKSGKARFINEARRADLLKEQGYTTQNAAPETQMKLGRQLGAKYMLTGSLVEMKETSARQVRVSKQKLNYYKLTVEITDLETNEILAAPETEFARQASQPLIGW